MRIDQIFTNTINDLQFEMCPKCHEHPKNLSYDNKNLHFEACCNEFGEILNQKTQELVAKYGQQYINESIKEAFR